MPVQVQFSPLHRQAIVVARGHVTMEEIREASAKLVDPAVRDYGKIIDASAANSQVTVEQVQRFAAGLRGPVGSPLRGSIAFVIDPDRPERDFAQVFAEATKEHRPIRLVCSLHEARTWLQQTMEQEQSSYGTRLPSAR